MDLLQFKKSWQTTLVLQFQLDKKNRAGTERQIAKKWERQILSYLIIFWKKFDFKC